MSCKSKAKQSPRLVKLWSAGLTTIPEVKDIPAANKSLSPFGPLSRQSGPRKPDQLSEFLINGLRDVGFIRIRPNRHSHADNTAAERRGCHSDVSAPAPVVGHFSNVID